MKFGTPQFTPFVEYVLPNMIKQLSVKIQIISSSADSAIRAVVSSTSYGYPKLISILIDQVHQLVIDFTVYILNCFDASR